MTSSQERTGAPLIPSLGKQSGPGASLFLLHGCMLLAGFGTVFLGPVLPVLASLAHATDRGSGLFFAAQFTGAFFGGVTTSRRLWRSLLRGSAAATLGFASLALLAQTGAPLVWDAAALLSLGFGVGQMLTSVNLLAARRFQENRGAGLSLVNFSLSLGAVLAPFALGLLLPKVALPALLLTACVLFALAFVGALIHGALHGDKTEMTGAIEADVAQRLPTPAFLYFASLLLIYGGVETSLSGWITTFGTRYGSGALQSSALGTTALWLGITAGRALSPLLLRSLRERVLLSASLGVAAMLVAILSRTQGTPTILTGAALLGLSLAPWFPLVLSGMLGEGAAAGQVGTIIAVSGLGAAAMPLLVGAVSTATGSLRLALLVPFAGLLLLLLLSFRRGRTGAPQTGALTPGGV